MAVAIVGMHRSGTSLVAALLHDLGLDLGPEEELMPAGPDNEDGYWQNRRLVAVNESVLGALGAAWDYPPTALDPSDPALQAAREEAAAAVGELATHPRWGWKDPCTTVTLEFWLDLFPDLRIVACVRNPLEVALSLRARNGFSYEHGLALWLAYNERLLAASPADRLLLTHYDAYFGEPAAELQRIATFCGLRPTRRAVEGVLPRCKRALRHGRFTFADVVAAGVSRRVIDVYSTLCEGAGWDDGRGDVAALPKRRRGERPGRIDRRVLDAQVPGRAAETPEQAPPAPVQEGPVQVPGTAAPAPEVAEETLRRRVAFREFREPPPDRAGSLAQAVSLVLDELDDRRVEHPAVLNLSRAAEPLDDERRSVVFTPPVPGGDLPYLDATVDVVVVDEQDAERIEQARRVASRALIVNGGAAGAIVEWLEEARDAYPSASIVLHSADSVADARTRAALLAKALPASLDVEFVIADDVPAGDLAVATHAISGSTRVRTVRGLGGAGLAERCSAAAQSAEGEIVVFVSAHLWLEPDWLRPLVRAFASDASVGAVGGKLIAGGRLLEAGRVLFSDGTSVGFGAGGDEPGAPLFNHTREVDGSSLDLLATGRDLFNELGGFEDRSLTPVYLGLDYCARVWRSGRRVLFQPTCVGVYPKGSTPADGALPPRGWVTRWRDDLERHPERPTELDPPVWHRLSARPLLEGAAR